MGISNCSHALLQRVFICAAHARPFAAQIRNMVWADVLLGMGLPGGRLRAEVLQQARHSILQYLLLWCACMFLAGPTEE